MPTSYSPLLGLALPVTGELAGTWGITVNDYITAYLDSSVAGTQTISGSQTAVTLTVTNGTALTIRSGRYSLRPPPIARPAASRRCPRNCQKRHGAATRRRARAASPAPIGSAIVTAWLIALTFPPLAPWWLIVTGTVFAIVVAKHLYGGLGQNPFNPAMVARVALLEHLLARPEAGVFDVEGEVVDRGHRR